MVGQIVAEAFARGHPIRHCATCNVFHAPESSTGPECAQCGEPMDEIGPSDHGGSDRIEQSPDT